MQNACRPNNYGNAVNIQKVGNGQGDTRCFIEHVHAPTGTRTINRHLWVTRGKITRANTSVSDVQVLWRRDGISCRQCRTGDELMIGNSGVEAGWRHVRTGVGRQGLITNIIIQANRHDPCTRYSEERFSYRRSIPFNGNPERWS